MFYIKIIFTFILLSLSFLCSFAEAVIDIEHPGITLPAPPSITSTQAKDNLFYIAEQKNAWTVGYKDKNGVLRFYNLSRTSYDFHSITQSKTSLKLYLKTPPPVTPTTFYIQPQRDVTVVKVNDKNYWVQIPFGRIKEKHIIEIPKSDKIKYYKENSGQRFFREQEAKGLILVNRKWVNKVEHEKALKTQKDTLNAEQKNLKNAASVAKRGFIYLQNGTLIEGEFDKLLRSTLYFKPDNEERAVGYRLAQISSDPPKQQMFRAYNALSAKYTNLFDNAILRLNTADALNAMQKFNHYYTLAPSEAQTKLNISYQHIQYKWNAYLISNNIAVYSDTIFNKDELNSKLKEGKIFFANQWIRPDQKCKTCKWTGYVKCSCQKNYVMAKCPKCTQGRVKCVICNGSGSVRCKACKASGLLKRTCAYCRGSGQTWNFRYYRPRITTMQNGQRLANGLASYGYWGVCENCNGRGAFTDYCPTCSGRGLVDCAKTVQCINCNGKGQVMQKCPTCHGALKKVCPDCHGKKIIE